jgi:hypothetical protein
MTILQFFIDRNFMQKGLTEYIFETILLTYVLFVTVEFEKYV